MRRSVTIEERSWRRRRDGVRGRREKRRQGLRGRWWKGVGGWGRGNVLGGRGRGSGYGKVRAKVLLEVY